MILKRVCFATWGWCRSLGRKFSRRQSRPQFFSFYSANRLIRTSPLAFCILNVNPAPQCLRLWPDITHIWVAGAGCRVSGVIFAPEGLKPFLNAPPDTEVAGFSPNFLERGAGFVPEGRLILARDFSPWKALEELCVPSGRPKGRPGGFTPASGPPGRGRGERSQTPNASPRLRPAWPGRPFQASRRDAGRGEMGLPGTKVPG